MSAMVQIFSWGERWNVPFNEAKPSWMIHFIFHRMKIFVPLHEWENIHYLFYITCTKIQILNRKSIEKWFKPKQNIFQAARATLRLKYYADACVTLNARTAPVAFVPRKISHLVFLISLVLEQTSKDCIGNTEYSNIKVNDECNSK